MRIAVLNWSNRRFGGTGTYLSAIVPRLRRAGHDVALWHEVDSPLDCASIATSPDVPTWSVQRLGLDPAVDALRAWRPDVLYAHGFVDPGVEARTLDVAPAVFFAHGHHGTCISGSKTVRHPEIRPCERTFGPACLAHYFPRGCGGRSPVTMLRLFRQQHSRLTLLRRYGAIVVHSDYLRREYIRHGVPAERVFNVKYGSDVPVGEVRAATPELEEVRPWRLLFAGRMERLKGGEQLIEAVPLVADALSRPIHLTLAGDGPSRARWEGLASSICQRHAGIDMEFPGWVGPGAIEGLFTRSDLLVVPSLWPEPLGLVGLEAARHGVPVAAFAVGGISDWLRSGTNGILAAGDPPTVRGLVDAICGCLATPAVHRRLRAGAGYPLSEFTMDGHVARLMTVFRGVTEHG